VTGDTGHAASITFNIPSTIVFGAGASRELPAQLKHLGATHALIVTDSFFVNNGLADEFVALLKRRALAASVFAEVQPDPTDRNVRAGLRAYRDCAADAIVALGGGSSIDAAKAIAMLTTNSEPMRQYMGYHNVPNAGAPMIAIPTTAGTGSEATRVAIITDTERREKMMMLSVHLMPTIALVDYELSMSMPKPLTAHVGVDTLTHGIEAYVSRKANGMTDPIALSCIALTATHLLAAWREPDNRAAREAMALAACQGGMAFSNSSVCLVHGMSRPLGAVYHVPHGLSNAVLLPVVTRFSLSGALTRYATASRIMGLSRGNDDDKTAAHKFAEGLEALNKALEIPPLRECIKVGRTEFENSLEKMAHDALASGSPQNNPVAPTVEQIVELYRQAW
jgi:alcohol dehydrogenase class IV